MDTNTLSDMHNIIRNYWNEDILLCSNLYINYHNNQSITTIYVSKIKNVIFNDPATIVFWTDGTKTVVKAQDGDIFDPEKGLAMAIAKKALGNKANYCNELKKWLPKEEESEEISEEVATEIIRSAIIKAVEALDD